MNILSGVEPRVVSARKTNENFKELQAVIEDLQKQIEELKTPAKKTKPAKTEEE